jgi:hypothetical protein
MRYAFTTLLLGWLLLLILPGSALKAQPIPRPEADSLLRVLAASKADTSRIKVLLRLGEYQAHKRGKFKADLDSAYAYAKRAENLSRTLRFERGYEESQRLLMRVLVGSNRMDEASVLLQTGKTDKTKAGLSLDLSLELGQHYLYKRGEKRIWIRQKSTASVGLAQVVER